MTPPESTLLALARLCLDELEALIKDPTSTPNRTQLAKLFNIDIHDLTRHQAANRMLQVEAYTAIAKVDNHGLSDEARDELLKIHEELKSLLEIYKDWKAAVGGEVEH